MTMKHDGLDMVEIWKQNSQIVYRCQARILIHPCAADHWVGYDV